MIEQKVRWYHEIVSKLSDQDLDKIAQYYSNWEYNGPISLKHRYVKLFVFDVKNQVGKWIRLDKSLNKRRIADHQLGNGIRKLIDNSIYPIRIFHSVSEWLDPRAVIHGNKKTHMISSGLLVFESDDSLYQSINFAQNVAEYVKHDMIFVYSGNQSIHVWWRGFEPQKYLDVDDHEFYLKREYYDRTARFEFYNQLPRSIKRKIDKRVIIDSRRVVPIINTLNMTTGRKTIQISNLELSPKDIMKLAEV